MVGEESLLERVGRGDRGAVAGCIEEYSGLVWSLARRFIANEADAEEAVQEIFLEIWSTAGRFDPARSGEATFISMIARRRLIDRVRKTRREPTREPLQDVEQLLSRDGHIALESAVDSSRVMQLMETMEPTQKQVLRMSTWLGMSHAAIAEHTELPLGTVKSHLRRGLLRIREQLADFAGTDGGESA